MKNIIHFLSATDISTVLTSLFYSCQRNSFCPSKKKEKEKETHFVESQHS